MRNFNEYKPILELESKGWIYDLFKIYDMAFNKYIVKNTEEKQLPFQNSERIFRTQWNFLLKIILKDFDNYFFPLEFSEGNVLPVLLNRKPVPAPKMDEDKVTNLILEIISLIYLAIKPFSDLGISNKMLVDYIQKSESKAPFEIMQVYVEKELTEILKPLSMFPQIANKEYGYQKRIAKEILPVYMKYGKHYGNKRIFLREFKNFIQRCLKLKDSELTIETIEKRLPDLYKK
jgi:hypothetical protein